jgi:hypothetical protein
VPADYLKKKADSVTQRTGLDLIAYTNFSISGFDKI